MGWLQHSDKILILTASQVMVKAAGPEISFEKQESSGGLVI